MAAMDQMSLSDIRNDLKKYGAKLSGRKKDLVERLTFYRTNGAKHGQSDTVGEYHMDLPNYSDFKDLYGDLQGKMPPIKQERILEYLALFGRQWDNKFKDLYDERFIQYVRIHAASDVYFTACVWAEMRKNTSYRVDVCLEPSGVVLEAQCECGAGQGPTAHCKHVVALLYGLTQFCILGKLVTEQSCTQTLQMFHRPKAYKGSPLKCKTLQDIRGQKAIDFDPRPSKYRCLSGKMDRVQNICLNHGMTNMPVMQLFKPANPVALTVDHDYDVGQDTDLFLKREKISCITSEELIETEKETQAQSTSKRWQEERQKRITSSNFGRVCKAVRTNLNHLARSFTQSKTINTAAILHGKKYERVALEEFEQKIGGKISACGLFVSKLYPFLAASPDAMLEQATPVEVKCPYVSRNQTISSVTVPYLVQSDDGLALDTKHDYYYQVQGQIMCTGAQECMFVVYTLKDLKYILIKRDADFIDIMTTKLITFYEEHFKKVIIDKQMYNDYSHFF